jgi:hypothetical protein
MADILAPARFPPARRPRPTFPRPATEGLAERIALSRPHIGSKGHRRSLRTQPTFLLPFPVHLPDPGIPAHVDAGKDFRRRGDPHMESVPAHAHRHAETRQRLRGGNRVPRITFVNKLDRPGADLAAIGARRYPLSPAVHH